MPLMLLDIMIKQRNNYRLLANDQYINLLLITNETTTHYCWIKNLSRLQYSPKIMHAQEEAQEVLAPQEHAIRRKK